MRIRIVYNWELSNSKADSSGMMSQDDLESKNEEVVEPL